MTEIFKGLPKVKFEGASSKNTLSFKFYDPDRVILGKKMSEHLPFAMAWWHTLCATGKDIFGDPTTDKSFGAAKTGTMEHAKAKVDAGFEFMQKLGVQYFCFHDVDLVPEADTLEETNARLDEITDYMLVKMQETGHQVPVGYGQHVRPSPLYERRGLLKRRERVLPRGGAN